MRKKAVIEIYPDTDNDCKLFIDAGFGCKMYINHIDDLTIIDKRKKE